MPDIIGVVALTITCLNGAMLGLTILSKASHFDRDVSNISLQLELQQYFLSTWAVAAGLTQDPPALYVGAHGASLILKIVEELARLLNDLDELRRRYRLGLTALDNDSQGCDYYDATLSDSGPNAYASIDRTKPVVFRRKQRPWKKLRWVTLDDKRVGKLLDDIKGYIADLEKFIESPRLAVRSGAIDGVLRSQILNVTDSEKLDIIGRESAHASSTVAIAAAARLKQTRLMLDIPQAPSPPLSPDQTGASQPSPVSPILLRLTTSNDPPPSMRLSIRHLALFSGARNELHRTLTFYKDKVVLLEWKRRTGPDCASLDRRVDQVAAFLHRLEPSFNSLACWGYVKDSSQGRYGYIYELPESFQSDTVIDSPPQPSLPSRTLPMLRTLRQLFDEPAPPPSLNLRLSIAVKLLETLLNLHTSGWLHKQLRSESLIFVHQRNEGERVLPDLSSYSMYIAGYVSARADDPGENTEPFNSDVESDLYQHPMYLRRPRPSFKKAFDIFSVACTLLEIGLWESLQKIITRHRDSSTSSRDIPKRPRASTIPRPAARPSATADSPVIAKRNSEFSKDLSYKDVRPTSSIDMMVLRQELLLSHLPDGSTSLITPPPTPPETSQSHPFPKGRSSILQSLEAAAGSKYTNMVEELLSAGSRNGGPDVDEEYALNVELRARDAVTALARAL